MFYLAYKSKAGNLIYLGTVNGKPQSVGGKALAMQFSSKEQAEAYKEQMSVNDRYQVVKDV